jgi:hypothetical protein
MLAMKMAKVPSFHRHDLSLQDCPSCLIRHNEGVADSPERSGLCAFVVAAQNKVMLRSIYNPGCKPRTLAGLVTALQLVYICDNHS